MKILDTVRGAYDLYKKHPVQFILGGLLLGLLNIALGFTLTGLHFYGMSFMAFKVLRGEKPEVADAFKGFQNFVAPFLAGLVFVAGALAAMVVFLVTGGHLAAGSLALVVGYTATGGLFLYACPLIADRATGAREALTRSLRYVRRDPARHLLLFLGAAALGYLGGLPGGAAWAVMRIGGTLTPLASGITLTLCLLGTFVTLPILFIALVLAYRDAAADGL